MPVGERKRADMNIAFFEKNEQSWIKLKEWLCEYTIRKDMDFSVLRFYRKDAAEVLFKYAIGISFAFISPDHEESMKIGKALARLNPHCYICYYAQKPCEFQPFLHTRPFDFYFGIRYQNDMDTVMDAMLSEYIQSSGTFLYETRRSFLYYPIKNIAYFQSDLKYVHVIETNRIPNEMQEQENTHRLYARLSDIEAELEKQKTAWCFVRIHKSYLVNQYHIASVDKQNHSVQLTNDEILPISASFYNEAIGKIRSFRAPVMQENPDSAVSHINYNQINSCLE